MYKKVVEFSFSQQKIFWVLVLSILIKYFAYPMNRSFMRLLLHEIFIWNWRNILASLDKTGGLIFKNAPSEIIPPHCDHFDTMNKPRLWTACPFNISLEMFHFWSTCTLLLGKYICVTFQIVSCQKKSIRFMLGRFKDDWLFIRYHSRFFQQLPHQMAA